MAQWFDSVWGPLTISPDAINLISCQEISTELARLRRLSQLGLVALQYVTAGYSRWEHHLGLTHLSQFVNVNRDQRRALEVYCLLDGIGHLPYGYPTERGLLRAARQSKHVAVGLISRLEPVFDMASRRGRLPFDRSDTLTRLGYKDFYRWLSAHKIKTLPRHLDLGNRERLIYESTTASGLYKTFEQLHRLDYLHRDLLHTGAASFRISTNLLTQFINHNLRAAEAMLSGLRGYLEDAVYFSTATAAREHLLSIAVERAVLSKDVSIDDLMQYTDDDLMQRLSALKLFDNHISFSTEFYPVVREVLLGEGVINPDLPTGDQHVVASAHQAANGRLHVLVAHDDHAGCHDVLSAVTTVARVALTNPRWEGRQPLTVLPYGEEVFSYLSGKEVTVNVWTAVACLQKIIRHCPEEVRKRVLPDLRGTDFQVDVVSIHLYANSVVVNLIECTRSDSDAKRQVDVAKLNALARAIISQHKDVQCNCITVGGAPDSVSPEFLLDVMMDKASDLPSIVDLVREHEL